MKFTFPMFALGWSGGERFIVNLSNELVKKGHEITFVVPKRGNMKLYPVLGNIIETSNFWAVPYLELPHSIISLLPKIPKSDFIVANWFLTAPTVKLAQKLNKGIPIYFIQHMEYLFYSKFRVDYKWYVKRTYNYFDNIISESNWIKETVKKYSGKDSVVINPGLEQDLFYPREKNKSIFTKDSHEKIILTIAREEFWKGNQDLIKALEIVYKTNKNFKLIAIGHKSSKYKTHIPIEYRKINHEDFPDYYSSCDLFIQASWYEGFGLTPLEAMACKTPVITTDCGGSRDFAVNEKNCLVVKPQNPPEMAKAIIRMLNDQNLRENLTKNGLKTAKKFTYSKMAGQWEKHMKTIIN